MYFPVLAAAAFAMAGGSVAVAAGGDTHDPRLRPVAADTKRAQGLLLTKADLPYGFHVYRKYGDPAPEFTGSCGRLADPDLSALTETANVSAACSRITTLELSISRPPTSLHQRHRPRKRKHLTPGKTT